MQRNCVANESSSPVSLPLPLNWWCTWKSILNSEACGKVGSMTTVLNAWASTSCRVTGMVSFIIL